VALALYATLPSAFLPALRYSVVALGIVLLVPLLAVNPVRFTRETRWSRRLSITQALVLALANQVALVQLIWSLVHAGAADGRQLLLSAAQVWITSVIVFALLYWEIDRGGPVARSVLGRDELPQADIRFPEDEDHDAVSEIAAGSSGARNWRPSFGDYLYSSLSNSMAFSATDAMPLSLRFKALMGLQAFSGFVVLALVIARAVNTFG